MPDRDAVTGRAWLSRSLASSTSSASLRWAWPHACLAALTCTAALSACSIRPITFQGDDAGTGGDPADASQGDDAGTGGDPADASPGDDAGASDAPPDAAMTDGPGEPATATVTVRRTGAGGEVTAEGATLTCNDDTCTATVPIGASVTLVARPGVGAALGGWTGGTCEAIAPTCQLTVTESVEIAVRFDVAIVALNIDLLGSGTGGVTATPGPTTCTARCTISVPYRTAVELTATPAADSVFTGWSGACSGTAACVVTMESGTAVTATFARRQHMLTVTVERSGNGSGTVSSNPAGITCGSDCSELYDANTRVTLTATPAAGSTFAGWGGACTGAGTCTVTMDSATSVTAAFSQSSQATLLVTNFLSPPGFRFFAVNANGNTAPLGVIDGAATALVSPRGVAIVGNEIVVADQNNNAIAVFALDARGDVAPKRQIMGSNTRLSVPASVLVLGGEIYAVQQTSSIVVFPLNASGNVAPSRVISGFGSNHYLAAVEGELYVTDFGQSRIVVFPASASGTPTPTRIITGPATGLNGPTGIAISGDEIIVANRTGSQILAFPRTASGNVAPLRVIGGSNAPLGLPDQLAIAGGEIFVSTFNNRVLVFPVNASGNVAPTRQITGASTQLALTGGIALF